MIVVGAAQTARPVGRHPAQCAGDYRRAFGEDPGDLVAVGVLTDVGDDGSRRRALYGDITVRQSSSTAPK
jgi:hypothetical protein